MGGETEHNQVCIGSVDTVPCIWVVVWTCSLSSDEVQQFVFSLAWHKCVGEDDCATFPEGVGICSVQNIRLERKRQSVHELGSRSDHIRVKVEPTFCRGHSSSALEELIVELSLSCGLILSLLGSSESP